MKVPATVLSAARRIFRRPASAVGIMLTSMLGIAISVSMFSVLNGVVLRSLPYPDADRIVLLHSRNLEQGVPRGSLTAAEAAELVAGVPGIESAGVYSWGGLVFEGDRRRVITTLSVSQGYFSVFGARPLLGRTFVEADFTEQRPVIVLTYPAWIDLAGGDPDIIGQTLPFEGQAVEVIGVMPETFTYLALGRIYRTLPASQLSAGNSWYLSSRYLAAVGRLDAGVSSEAVDRVLQARLAALHSEHGVRDDGWQLGHVPLIDDLVGSVRQVLFALFGVTVLVLFIACATSACLVSIRLDRRRAELAVRRTLGASAERIVLDAGVELLLMSVAAAIGGVLLAQLMVGVIRPLAAGNLPRTDGIAIDLPVLVFAAIVTIAITMLSSVVPLTRALRQGPSSSLGMRGGIGGEMFGARRLALLPSIGVGLSAVAVVTALALAVSLLRLERVDPGFRAENITGFQVFHNEAAQTPQFVERALEELGAVPGVSDAVAVSATPYYIVGRVDADAEVPGSESGEVVTVGMLSASPGYHEFLGIPLVRGRGITDLDTSTARDVVVVNETFARRAFGDGDPLGRELLITAVGEQRSYEIVGIAADTRNAGLRQPAEPELVVPVSQTPFQAVTLLVDSASTRPGFVRTVEEAIEAARPLRPRFLAE